MYKVDGISQELDQELIFRIDFDSAFLGTAPHPVIRDTMMGIIQDSDRELARHTYTEHTSYSGTSDKGPDPLRYGRLPNKGCSSGPLSHAVVHF